MKQSYLRKALAYTGLATQTLTQGLALVGLLALVILIVGPKFDADSGAVRDAQADSIAEAGGLEQSLYAEVDGAIESQQRTLAAYLARRYRVAGDALDQLVRDAYQVGHQWKIDPLLILSVVAIESSFNPIAESGYGAKGLMQVVPRFHLDKLDAHGGHEALLDPSINIQVGAQILKTYIRQTGSLESGLQMYGGATSDPESRYARKVMAEQARLRRVLSANASSTKI